MPKIEVNKAAEIMQRYAIEPAKLRQILEEMNHLAQAQEDPTKPPPVKKQWAIMISDPEGKLPKEDLVGWVLQLPESESVLSTEERIHKAAYDFNTTKKGRLMPATTIGEAIEHVPAKHFKEVQVWVKNKVPVLMLKTNNRIPSETTDKDARRGRT